LQSEFFFLRNLKNAVAEFLSTHKMSVTNNFRISKNISKDGKMEVAEKHWNKFYEKLGYLCYAIAACDKKVTHPEIVKLKDLVKNDWLYLEETEYPFGSDAAYQIEILFDSLEENIPPTEYACEEFSDFVKSNEDFFSSELKQKVIRTIDKIASAYSAKNKSELTMLFNLYQLVS